MKKFILLIAFGLFAINVLAENIPYEQAKKAGVKKCLPAIKKITDFIIKDDPIGAHSIWDTTNPSSSPFSTIIEKDYSDGSIMFANIVVSPTLTGECYVEYERILNFNKPCVSVSQAMKDGKYQGEVNKSVSFLKEDSNVFDYLLPNGNQCTMVKKEIYISKDK